MSGKMKVRPDGKHCVFDHTRKYNDAILHCARLANKELPPCYIDSMKCFIRFNRRRQNPDMIRYFSDPAGKNPLFDFDLKLLPNVVSWFDGARTDSGENMLDAMKLNAIYQFARAMPDQISKPPTKLYLFNLHLRLTMVVSFAMLFVCLWWNSFG